MLNLIFREMINRVASETGVEQKSRTFAVVSHVATMLYAQLSDAMGLNDPRIAVPCMPKSCSGRFWGVYSVTARFSPRAGRQGKGLLRPLQSQDSCRVLDGHAIGVQLHGLSQPTAPIRPSRRAKSSALARANRCCGGCRSSIP